MMRHGFPRMTVRVLTALLLLTTIVTQDAVFLDSAPELIVAVHAQGDGNGDGDGDGDGDTGGGGTMVDPMNPSLIPAGNVIPGCNFKTGDIHAACIPEYIGYLIELIFMLIGAFFLIMIIVAGYQIAIGTVVGEKEKGKEKLKWAIAGFIISALSFFIISFFISALSGT